MLDFVILIALITAFGFVACYSAFQWEKTPQGVNSMLMGVAVGILAVCYLTDSFDSLVVLPTLTWSFIAVLFAHRISFLLRPAPKE